MGSFGYGVASLLDTYSKCLAVLEKLTRRSKATDEQTRLSGSIRSSRSRVRKYYSSKLSESGSSFEKGDATARNSLKRLVRRFRAFLDGILKALGNDSHSSIDYDSLVALSQGSGLEAIRTMTDLSDRVGRRAVGSSHSTRSRHHRNSSVRTRSKSTGSRSTDSSTRNASGTTSKLNRRPSTLRQKGSRRSSNSHEPDGRDHRQGSSHRNSRCNAESLDRRKSILTSSSDSTKLGETRHREQPRQAHATYPLWTYPREPVKLKKGKLFGLFGR